MSDRTLLGGGLAGLVSLPFVAGALLTGGLLIGLLALVAVAALVAGTAYGAGEEGQDCLRCGVTNDDADAVCSVCGAQL
jgi:hypothetical protein